MLGSPQKMPWAWRGLLSWIAFRTCHAYVGTECDVYSVELQATFDHDVLIPCTNEEIIIIEALIHSLVQTDAIVGLNRLIPVPPFFLAFEEFGSGVKRSFVDVTFPATQLELSQPHLSVADQLEDMYYAYEATTSQQSDGNTDESDNTSRSEDNNDETSSHHKSSDAHNSGWDTNGSGFSMKILNKGESKPPKKEESQVPPPPVILEEDSLRQGDIDRRRQEPSTATLPPSIFGGSPSPIPSENPIEAPTALPSGSYSESPSGSSSTLVPSEHGTLSGSTFVPSNSPSSDATTDTTSNPTKPASSSCDADWCASFLTRPCDHIPHDKDVESTEKFKLMLERFEARVEEAILVKLRKWARDTNTMCLGNSWELNAIVMRML